MKIAVRYQSRGGNTKAVAEMISKEFHTQALSVDNPINDYIDILFLGGGVYEWKMDNSLCNFIERLPAEKNRTDYLFFYHWAYGQYTKTNTAGSGRKGNHSK